MCVTNIYVDVYPDGKTQEFRQIELCQYGAPGRPCAKASTLENPVRKIQWGELTTEYILTQGRRAFPQTPPRSSGGSHHRVSGAGDNISDDGIRRHSSRRSRELPPKVYRQHRKAERIVIVDSPPTPRTPPQTYSQTFTAPNSPNPATRGRPIIVDERPRPRIPSVGAVISERPSPRPRSQSRVRVWDSPSTSHTSFDLRARREEEERELRRTQERDDRIAELEAEQRRRSFAAHDEEIRRRPAVPIVPLPLRQRAYLRPVIDQSPALHDRQERALIADEDARRRLEARDRLARRQQEDEEAEAMKQRLRERQMPARRFSVGPAQRRHRVLYDDGMYRWE